MSHPVKCFYCEKRFDRDREPYERVGERRFAHKSCYDFEQARNSGTFPFDYDGDITKERDDKNDSVGKGDKMSRNVKTAEVNQNTMKMLTEMQHFMMQTIATANADEIFEQVMPKINDRIHEVYGFLPEIHEIKLPTETHTVQGVLHEKFDEVLKIVSLDIPVYLTGKAGTGKNVICKQVAEALGLEFYFTNAVTQEYKLTGFIDANGTYQETQFYKAFTQGGVFFLDEMDASIPETLVILNAAIANRYFDFPIGKVDAHPDFRIIAAGNTLGTGADNNYTGRYCLDRASLDRFALVHIDYSPKIEMSMAANNKELVDFCHIFRKITDKAGIECLFSYRTINRIAKLEKVFDNLQSVIQISLLKGLDFDDVNIIGNELSNYDNMKNNKYAQAIRAMTF
jgi:hypothetical protein